jgi:hypothetical protein
VPTAGVLHMIVVNVLFDGKPAVFSVSHSASELLSESGASAAVSPSANVTNRSATVEVLAPTAKWGKAWHNCRWRVSEHDPLGSWNVADPLSWGQTDRQCFCIFRDLSAAVIIIQSSIGFRHSMVDIALLRNFSAELKSGAFYMMLPIQWLPIVNRSRCTNWPLIPVWFRKLKKKWRNASTCPYRIYIILCVKHAPRFMPTRWSQTVVRDGQLTALWEAKDNTVRVRILHTYFTTLCVCCQDTVCRLSEHCVCTVRTMCVDCQNIVCILSEHCVCCQNIVCVLSENYVYTVRKTTLLAFRYSLHMFRTLLLIGRWRPLMMAERKS